MNNKKLVLTAFIIVALAQLYVPAKMILEREDVLVNGIEYKFRTAPIDPNDPFRGKYINLQFENNVIEIKNEDNWLSGEDVYVTFIKDKDGFAKTEHPSKTKPSDEISFVKAKVSFNSTGDSQKLIVDYPFNRYYMEESKAYEAEDVYRKSLSDSNVIVYALVRIKGGDAVLKDVMINDVSIKDMVISERKKRK